MTFIVRTRLGDIDVNPKNHPMGRRELLERARRLVKRAIQEGEGAHVFEKANGREAAVDVMSGEYIRTGSPVNMVAAGLQKRGGAGAGSHRTRTRDVSTGRARSGRHGGRAGMIEHENPHERPKRGQTKRPDSATWKEMTPEQKAEIDRQIAFELLARIQDVDEASLLSVMQEGGLPTYPEEAEPVNPFKLHIYSDIPDVKAAAEALHIPVEGVPAVKQGDAPPWESVISIDRVGQSKGNIFVLTYPDTAPRVMAKSKAFKWPALELLAQWLRDTPEKGGVRRVLVYSRRPGSKGFDPVAYPAIGDAIYFLGKLPELQPEVLRESILRAPFSGRVVDIKAGSVTIEDPTNFGPAYADIATKVALAKAELFDLRSRASVETQQVIKMRDRIAEARAAAAVGLTSKNPEVIQEAKSTLAQLDLQLSSLNDERKRARGLDAADTAYEKAYNAFYGNAEERIKPFGKIQTVIQPLVPALAYEANADYPSLTSNGTLLEVQRAAKALFGADIPNPSIGVSAAPDGALWGATLYARNSFDKTAVAEALGQIGTLIKERENDEHNLDILTRGDPLSKPLIDAARERLRKRDPNPTVGQARARAIGDVEFRLNKTHAEIGRLEAFLREKTARRLTFRGKIQRRSTLIAGSQTAPLADGIELGASVTKGQAVTRVPERTTDGLPRSKAETFIVPNAAYLQRGDEPYVAAMFDKTPSNSHVRSVLVREKTRLPPDGVGSLMVQVEGEPKTVYVTPVGGGPVTVAAAIQMYGGATNLLQKIGAITGAAHEGQTPQQRAVMALSPTDVAGISRDVFPTDMVMQRWLRGDAPAYVLELSTQPPVGTTTRISTPTHLEPMSASGGKKVAVSRIAHLCMYGFYQDYVLDITPVETFGPQDLMEDIPEDASDRDKRFNTAIARAGRMISKVNSRAQAWIAKVQAIQGNKARVEAFVDVEHMTAAAKAAQRYGLNVNATSPSDFSPRFVDSLVYRILGRRLRERLELKDETGKTGLQLLAQLEEERPTEASWLKLAEAARRVDPEARVDADGKPMTTKMFLARLMPNGVLSGVKAIQETVAAQEAGKLTKEEANARIAEVNAATTSTAFSYAVTPFDVYKAIVSGRKAKLEPAVITDPMAEVLLVAIPKPDADGLSMGAFEVVIVDGVPRKGAGGKQLTKKINAFCRIGEIGYVSKDMPASKDVTQARKDLANAQALSYQAGLAAARRGESTVERGVHVGRGISPRSERSGMVLSPGASIERGKGSGGPASYGTLSSGAGQSRMDLILMRYEDMFPAEAANVQAIRGKQASARDIAEDEQEKIIRAEMVMGTGPLLTVKQRDAQVALARAREEAARLAELQYMEERAKQTGPRRKGLLNNPGYRAELTYPWRQNPPPDYESLFTALSGATEREAKFAKDLASALIKLAANTKAELNQEENTALKGAGYLLAILTMGFRSIGDVGNTSSEVVQEMLDEVLKIEFIKSLSAEAEPSFTVKGIKYPVTGPQRKALADGMLAGPLYSVGANGVLAPRNDASVNALFTRGLRWAAWIDVRSTVRVFEAETTAITKNSRSSPSSRLPYDPVALVQQLRDTPPDRLNNAARVLVESTVNGVNKVVASSPYAFVLTPASLALLTSPQGAVSAVGSIMELRGRAEKAYDDFLSALLPARGEAEQRPEILRTLQQRYEQAVAELQRRLQALEQSGQRFDEEAAIASASEAAVVHRLVGRTGDDRRPGTRDDRLTQLRGPVARHLGMRGRPLIPVDSRLLESKGLQPMDYGEGYTLSSRPSLQEFSTLITQVTAKAATRPVATATLMCRPGNRTVGEFAAPLNRYKPTGWDEMQFGNVIWISPDSRLVRLYRMGAPVCVLRRHAGEPMQDFLDEVAENWNLWLTDPVHQRQGRDLAQVVWMGQSGAKNGLMYRLNSKADQGRPLSRNVMAKRMARAGVSLAKESGELIAPSGALLDTKTKEGMIKRWSDNAATIEADANMFLTAMREKKLVSLREVDEVLERLFGGESAQVAGAKASREAKPDLIVLTPPRAPGDTRHLLKGYETLPVSIKPVVDFLVGKGDASTVRVYDQWYNSVGNTRIFSLEAALDEVRPSSRAKAGTGDESALAAAMNSAGNSLTTTLLLTRIIAGLGPKLDIVAPMPAGRALSDVVSMQEQLAQKEKGVITFSPAAQVLQEAQKEALLKVTLSAYAPVLIVDLGEQSNEASGGGAGMDLLAATANILSDAGPVPPILYLTAKQSAPSARQVEGLRKQIADKLKVDASEVPIMYATYATLPSYTPQLVAKIANPKRRNPRQREVRQVASLYMRTYPFLG